MKITQSLTVLGMLLTAVPSAGAFPLTAPGRSAEIVQAQLNCTGPRCLSAGPIRRPYLRGTRPSDLPGREIFRRMPERPPIVLPKPQMDYRVPRMEQDRPLVRQIRPPDPTYRAVGVSRRHIEWCYEQYRSYRETDNSYQPFTGVRRQCRSPFL